MKTWRISVITVMILVFSSLIFCVAMAGCDCGCSGDTIELQPVNTTMYKLYISDNDYRTVIQYDYDMPDKTITLYRNPDKGVFGITVLEKNPRKTTYTSGPQEDEKSILNQESYFEY